MPPTDNPRSEAFQSLVEKSIVAWNSISFVGGDKNEAIEKHSTSLRKLDSIQDVLSGREYWFFQTREDFLSQSRPAKWDLNCLDRYVILPIDYGFVNSQDCYFISHFWRTKFHPDPEGTDLSQFREDLQDQEWSYVWLDWTCMPQVPRSENENRYFRKMLRSIPLLVQDCAFEWRFPTFEPRAWVLFEVATWLLNHSRTGWPTDDMAPFARHVGEMVSNGVIPTLEKHEYRCTTQGDMRLVTGWMEILVILFKIIPDMRIRQDTISHIFAPFVGSYSNPVIGLAVDKSAGTITLNGTVHIFTPVFALTLD